MMGSFSMKHIATAVCFKHASLQVRLYTFAGEMVYHMRQ